MKISAGKARLDGPLCLYDEAGDAIALMSDKRPDKERLAMDIMLAFNAMGWQPIETAPLGEYVRLHHPMWRHEFVGQRNGSGAEVYVDWGETGWQTVARWWQPLGERPEPSLPREQVQKIEQMLAVTPAPPPPAPETAEGMTATNWERTGHRKGWARANAHIIDALVSGDLVAVPRNWTRPANEAPDLQQGGWKAVFERGDW